MRITLCALIALAAAGSVSARDLGHSMRSLAKRAIHKAHTSKVSARKLQETVDVPAWADMGEEICKMLEDDTLQGMVLDMMETEAGVVCSEFGCENLEGEAPTLEMDCSMDGVQEIQSSMVLDFVGDMQAITNTCFDIDTEACLKYDVTMDMGGFITFLESNEELFMDPTMTEVDVANSMMEYITINECSLEFEGELDSECECGVCPEGIGVSCCLCFTRSTFC